MGVSPHFYHHDPVVAVQLGCVEDDVRSDGEGKVLAYDESHDGDAWQAKVKKTTPCIHGHKTLSNWDDGWDQHEST
jgi:hypothetical protein